MKRSKAGCDPRGAVPAKSLPRFTGNFMMFSRRLRFLNNSFLAGACMLALSLPALSANARESWPEPTEEAKRAAAEARTHEEAVWKKIEPEVQAWAAKGKPYIPNAGRPGVDLPQATVPAGARAAGIPAARICIVTLAPAATPLSTSVTVCTPVVKAKSASIRPWRAPTRRGPRCRCLRERCRTRTCRCLRRRSPAA